MMPPVFRTPYPYAAFSRGKYIPYPRSNYYKRPPMPYSPKPSSNTPNQSYSIPRKECNITPPIEEDKNAKKEEETNCTPLFEIFGIRLYYDDILLLALLFFLYKEEVKDPSLFISLILLLLS